jgi:leucyl-tRNA synthetase
MADAGLIDFVEPFSELKNQGILHSAVDGQKMSKSKGNVVTPDEVIARHGTDALRLYVVFLGPFDADVVWDDAGIRGMTRFLERFWRLAGDIDAKAQSSKVGKESEEFERERHRVIKRVTADMEGYRFNTAVAALMEYLNYLHDHRDVPADQWQQGLESFAVLLAPFAPFITEEVWQTVWGHTDSIHRQSWPVYDEALTTAVTVRMAVQINGKVRDHITIPADTAEAEIRQLAVAQVQRYVDGRTPHNIIIVPGRLVNIVIGNQ